MEALSFYYYLTWSKVIPFAQVEKELVFDQDAEGEVGEGAKVDEEVGKEEEEHGWRREDGGVQFQ